MDGLIKGLINVALDAVGNDDGDRQSGSQNLDERSRSTWAQVVTGEEDKDEEENGGQRQGHRRAQWSREEEKCEQTEEWEIAGSRPSRRPQKIVATENISIIQTDAPSAPPECERIFDRLCDEYTEWMVRAGKQLPPEWKMPDLVRTVIGAAYEGYDNDEYGGQHDNNQNYRKQKEEKEESNDGWETVGKKTPRRPQKVKTDNWHKYKQPASEQEYSDEIRHGINTEPSEEELADLSLACNKLWELDLNRLVPGKDYQIDCGEGKKVYQKGDMAEGSLFYWMDEDVFRRPTFSRFCSLLDNYNPHEGYKESVTSEERQEQAAFIEEISRTAPIKYLFKYLSTKGIVSGNYQDFKGILTNLWFDLYGRGGTSSCSSAFEHVFVGEIKNRGEQEVSGFHNWLQFYLEEAKGRVDYQGYIFPRRRGQQPDSETQLLTIQFEWNGVLKSVSSTLVGVSPEFEIALYTLCFFLGGEDNQVELGPYPVNIKCYRLGNKIGSVFPIAEC